MEHISRLIEISKKKLDHTREIIIVHRTLSYIHIPEWLKLLIFILNEKKLSPRNNNKQDDICSKNIFKSRNKILENNINTKIM